MVTCRECNKEFKAITHAHLKSHSLTRITYKIKYPSAIIQSQENFDNLSKAQKGKKMGNCNPASRPEVKEKISNSVKKMWDEGRYESRINGMTSLCGELHHSYDPLKNTQAYLAKTKYVSFLSQFEDVHTCKKCGFTSTSPHKINIHHIDENRDNYLPSNLVPLCIPCHSDLHYSRRKKPFISIGKTFSFAAAHRLPQYEGACFNWHGHEWSMEVVIKSRIDKNTGMVLDFSVLKNIVKEFVIDKLDHSSINDVLSNPTAENMLLWIWETLIFDAHLKGIEEISLWETPTSKATLTKLGMLSVLENSIEEYVTAHTISNNGDK